MKWPLRVGEIPVMDTAEAISANRIGVGDLPVGHSRRAHSNFNPLAYETENESKPAEWRRPWFETPGPAEFFRPAGRASTLRAAGKTNELDGDGHRSGLIKTQTYEPMTTITFLNKTKAGLAMLNFTWRILTSILLALTIP